MAPVIYSTDHPHLMATNASSPTQGQPRREPTPHRIQSRETGDVPPEAALTFAKSWDHLIAGGYGPPPSPLAHVQI